MADPAFGVLRLPAQVSFGPGAFDSLPIEVARLGRRALVCADPFLADTTRLRDAVDAVRRAGVEVTVFTDIAPELPVAEVERAAAELAGGRPDVLVGIGGGSTLDFTKLVAVLLAHGGPLSAYYGEHAVPGPVLPVIAVPTTAGSGSEVTPVAVVADADRELKVGISSRWIVPQVAIVDPALTLGVPGPVAAHAGIDAFVHAVEAYTAGRRAPAWDAQLPIFVGRNRLSSVLALEAVGWISGNLRQAVADPFDVPAHEAMSYGSLLAGMAFASAGTHLSHALQYPVGALSKTPHGLGTGLLLPRVLEVLAPLLDEELRAIGAAMGLAPEAGAGAVLDAVQALVTDIGIPAGLADLGIARADLPRIAELALGIRRLVDNGPGPADTAVLGAILERAHPRE